MFVLNFVNIIVKNLQFSVIIKVVIFLSDFVYEFDILFNFVFGLDRC